MTTSDAYGRGQGSAGTGPGGFTAATDETDSRTGNDGTGVIDQIKDAGAGVVDQTSEIAGSMVDKAKDQAGSQLDSQRQQLAGSFASAAGALHHTGQQLRDEDQANIAGMMDIVAERIDGFGRYLSERRLDDLLSDVEGVARREPGLFLTAAFGAGLLAARFLKSGNAAGSGNRDVGQRARYSQMNVYGGTTGYEAKRPIGGTVESAPGYSARPNPPNPAPMNRPWPEQRQHSGAQTGAGVGSAETVDLQPNGHGVQSDWNEG